MLLPAVTRDFDELRIELEPGTEWEWVAEITWGSGNTNPVDLPLQSVSNPPYPAGWLDVVFTGADHAQFGMFVAVNGDLVRVTDEARTPYDLVDAPAYGISMESDCPGDGTIIQRHQQLEYVPNGDDYRIATLWSQLRVRRQFPGG